MGEASTGQRRGRLRGARQWIPLLCRAGETAADLRFTGAGAHRPAVSEMAEANSLAVASGGSAGRLRLGPLGLADGSEPDADLRPAPAGTGILRRDYPRQPGSWEAGPRATDLRPRGDEEDARRVPDTRDAGRRASESSHQLQKLRSEAVLQGRARVPNRGHVQEPERFRSQQGF